MSEVKLIPVTESLPEDGTECVILINGNSYGTAVYESVGYISEFVNDRYDNFSSSDVTHYLPIVKIPY